MSDLFIIVGRTASGKDTLAENITRLTGKTMAISHTTRKRRKGEGDTHIFIDDIEDYPHRWVDTYINGNYYFILEDDVKNNDIIIIDPIGLASLLKQASFKRPYQVLYIDIDRETRCHRYTSRGNVPLDVFIQRDDAEHEQFAAYEKLISNPQYRQDNNVTILSNDDDIQHFLQSLSSGRASINEASNMV